MNPAPDGPAAVVVVTVKGSVALAPLAIAPVKTTWKPVMYWPGSRPGAPGKPAPWATTVSAGASPVLTVHETVAPVAPAGQTVPDVNPPKPTSDVKNVPVPGSF